MQKKKIDKKLLIIIGSVIGFVILVLLVALFHSRSATTGRSKQPHVQLTQTQQPPNNSGSSEASTPIIFKQGQPIINNEYVSVPITISNNGNNNLFFDTQELALQVTHHGKTYQKHLFYTKTLNTTKVYNYQCYSPFSKSTNYNLNLANGNQLQTFVTFKVNNKVTDKECKQAKVIYHSPSGKNYQAKQLSVNAPVSELTTQLSNTLDTVGDYYNNIRNIEHDSKTNNQSLQQTAKQDTNDNDYLNFYMNVYELNNKQVMLAMNNQTNTDLALNLKNFELYDDSNEVYPSINLMNYDIFVPHKKHCYTIIPLQTPLIKNGNYQVRLRPSSNDNSSSVADNNFQDTLSLVHPAHYHSLFD